MADRGSVVVIGLGRFGTAVARTLADLGHDVLGMDVSARRVADLQDALTHVVEADSTDQVVLGQLGIKEFDRAVVAIGGDIEASILTTSALVDAGMGQIWAKANTGAHAKILQRVGAHHVVFPEAQMGERVANLLSGSMLEFLPLDAAFALVEVEAPTSLLGTSLAALHVRDRYGVTIVCVKPRDGLFTYATADTVLAQGDVVVVAGETKAAAAFASVR